jgi:hypothetical protein
VIFPRTDLSDGPVTLVNDSTGLKVYGASKWHRDKHGVCGRRIWRKLHLTIDTATSDKYCVYVDLDPPTPFRIASPSANDNVMHA